MKRPIATNVEIRALRSAGWQIEDMGGNRVRWTAPGGAALVSGKFVRDHRAAKNHTARLKRAAQPPTHAYN